MTEKEKLKYNTAKVIYIYLKCGEYAQWTIIQPGKESVNMMQQLNFENVILNKINQAQRGK